MVERIRKSGKVGPNQRGNPPAKAQLPKRRRRLDPEDREREILDGAVAFFAEVGFDGGLWTASQDASSNREGALLDGDLKSQLALMEEWDETPSRKLGFLHQFFVFNYVVAVRHLDRDDPIMRGLATECR